VQVRTATKKAKEGTQPKHDATEPSGGKGTEGKGGKTSHSPPDRGRRARGKVRNHDSAGRAPYHGEADGEYLEPDRI